MYQLKKYALKRRNRLLPTLNVIGTSLNGKLIVTECEFFVIFHVFRRLSYNYRLRGNRGV